MCGTYPRLSSLHKHVLDYVGVQQIALVIGGSMGGMLSLEWPLCFPVRNPGSVDALPNGSKNEQPYIRGVALLASPARHSAWSIAWSEIQRASIAADARYKGGRYLLSDPPEQGLASARMCAMMTYRHPDSVDRRFRRLRGKQNLKPAADKSGEITKLAEKSGTTPAELAKIEGQQSREMFAVQSYLKYQGEKFLERFDTNCYVHLTHKLDAHDAARDRHSWAKESGSADSDEVLAGVLRHLGTSPVGCKIITFSITSDLVYPPPDQYFIHHSVPGSQLQVVDSSEGHDAFLLNLPSIENAVRAFMQKLSASAKL